MKCTKLTTENADVNTVALGYNVMKGRIFCVIINGCCVTKEHNVTVNSEEFTGTINI